MEKNMKDTIVIVPKYIVSKEAKRIKKITSDKHTVILEKIITSLGYQDYEEYNKYSENKNNDLKKCINIHNLNIVDLKNIERKIMKKLNLISCFKIVFIQDIIDEKIEVYKKEKKGYLFSVELFLYPALNDLEISFIETNFIINETCLEKYILHIATRYKHHKLNEQIFKNILINKTPNHQEIELIEELNLYEIIKYTKENKENNNSEDFILQLIYNFIYIDNSLENVVEKIKKRILLEKKYLQELKNDEIESFKVPILNSNVTEEYLPESIFKHTDINNPVLLGLNIKKKFLKNETKALCLNIKEIKENIYIQGSGGSGYSLFSYHFLSQIVLNNSSGFIHFDFLGDSNSFEKNSSYLKIVNKNDNLLYFNINNIESINEKMLRSFVLNNKKIHIEVPFLCKKEKKELIAIESKLIKIFENIKKINNHNSNTFFISLLNTNYFSNEFYVKLKNIICDLNNNNFSFLTTDWGLDSISKERTDFIDVFKHKLMAKSEEDNAYYYFGINRNEYNLNVGQFIYINDKKLIDTVFTTPYINVNCFDTFTLTLPIGFE
jgi:hypothetical protein